MRYYLLRKGREFVIYRVKDELVLEFLEKYSRGVLEEAGDLIGLLLAFERNWMFGLEWVDL